MEASLPEPRRIAIATGAVIALLGAFGAIDLLAPSLELSAFSLEGERTVPAAFSAALLLAAGVLAWRLSAVRAPRALGSPGLWRFMGAFLVFMALDELLAIHERVSMSESGISWQVFYAPVTVAAIIAWAAILRRLPSVPARRMWLGGAAAWFVSQVIEAIQWDGNRLVHEWTFVPEETLEMTGSLLWGLALLLALRMVREPEGREHGEVATATEPVARDFRLRQRRRKRRDRGPGRTGRRPAAPTGRTPGPR
jgi:hypothetical protein